MRIYLNEKLKEKNISILSFSKMLHLSYGTTYKLVHGKATTLNLNILGMVVDILEVDLDEILRKVKN